MSVHKAAEAKESLYWRHAHPAHPGIEGTAEWNTWAAEARQTEDFKMFNEILQYDGALHRMAAFCEVCDGHFVPGQGTVSWFRPAVNIRGRKVYSACNLCMDKLDGTQQVEFTA
jgi:hypothetical protein